MCSGQCAGQRVSVRAGRVGSSLLGRASEKLPAPLPLLYIRQLITTVFDHFELGPSRCSVSLAARKVLAA